MPVNDKDRADLMEQGINVDDLDPNQVIDDCVPGVDCWLCAIDAPHRHAAIRARKEQG